MQLETISHSVTEDESCNVHRIMQCDCVVAFLLYSVSSLALLLSLHLLLPLSLTLSFAFSHCSCLMTHSAGWWTGSGPNDHCGHAGVQHQEWNGMCRTNKPASLNLFLSNKFKNKSCISYCSTVHISFCDNTNKLWNDGNVCMWWTLISVWLESVN